MWTHMVFGTDLYHFVQWFIIYSFLGWLVESIYMSFCNRKLTNRGFASSPFCPIYAVGALSVFAILKPLDDNYVALYFAGALLATALEYLVALAMKSFLGAVWWDYTDKPFNYRGIICLESTIAWGFYTVFMFAFLHRFVRMVASSYPFRAGMVLAAVVIVVYGFDFFLHLFMARKERLPRGLEAIKNRMENFWQEIRY